MKLQEFDVKACEGKIISFIDNRFCNQIRIYFTDGSFLELEAELVHSGGLYGIGGKLFNE